MGADKALRAFAGKGLVVLAVDSDESRDAVKRYLSKSPRSCSIVLGEDTNLGTAFSAPAFPYYVVIDQNGNIAGTKRGEAGEGGLRALVTRAVLD